MMPVEKHCSHERIGGEPNRIDTTKTGVALLVALPVNVTFSQTLALRVINLFVGQSFAAGEVNLHIRQALAGDEVPFCITTCEPFAAGNVDHTISESCTTRFVDFNVSQALALRPVDLHGPGRHG